MRKIIVPQRRGNWGLVVVGEGVADTELTILQHSAATSMMLKPEQVRTLRKALEAREAELVSAGLLPAEGEGE